MNPLPTQNVYAPDYYIPLMSMITFVLLRCLSMGILNDRTLDPAMIVGGFWKCVIISSLEVFIVRIVFMFIDGVRVSLFDLVAFLNYRYCSYAIEQSRLCLLVLLNILTEGSFYMALLGYALLCQCFFVYKTLQRYSGSQNHSALGKMRRL